jgi:hypothetical protein
MAVIEATRPAFWVQLAVSTQPSALGIQPFNLIRAFSRSFAAQTRLRRQKAGHS